MIVRNEEDHIGRCLASLKGHVDDIVVVDTGSTDKTVEICKSYGARIYNHPWEDSFSIARNQAMSYVETEWMIQLDADEEMDEESAPKIRDIVKSAHKSKSNLVYLVLENVDPATMKATSVVNTGKIIRMGVGTHYKNRIHNKLVIGDSEPRLTGLKIRHYGYNLSAEIMEKKRQRTTSLLLIQLEEQPNDPETNYYLAIQYLRADDWQNAIKYSERAQNLFKEHEPQSQLLLLAYHIGAVAFYETKRYKEAEELSLEALKLYPDYVDANSMMCSITFALKRYKDCEFYSKKYLAGVRMIKQDPSKSLVVPMNTMNNEWKVFAQLAINHYEQADSGTAIQYLAQAEDLLPPAEKYKPSFTVFKYMIQRGDNKSLRNAEIIYSFGFRPDATAKKGG
jgi:glycosyltransferase involved in cell wall biosynthesis